jgi:hypothetical protein
MWAISSASLTVQSPTVGDECGGDPTSQSIPKLLLDARVEV